MENDSLLIDQILEFWLGSDLDDAESIKAKSPMWFRSTPAIDTLIDQSHSDDIERAAYGDYAHFEATPRGRVALIILFDQMPRNIFRGSAHAFAFDPLALEQSLALVRSGEYRQLHQIEQSFCFMPLEHAEDLEMQELCVEKFTELAAEARSPHEKLLEGYVKYAKEHRDIVARFGRFPHRNAVLEREPTPEETAFLADGGPNFGQGGGSKPAGGQ